jgi:uncharacterized protein YciI
MFVILLTYVKPLDVIDSLMRKHMAWLNAQYANGTFVVSGRRVPRTGGVIIARGIERAQLDAIVAADPFVSSGAATVEVIEFNASQSAEALRGLL